MFEIATKGQSVSVEEAVAAYSSSLQYEPAAEGGTEIPSPPSNWFEGDVAAGLRTLTSDARVRGDFATGMRSTPLLITTGDFAAGQRTKPPAKLIRGDFATGQRTERSATRTPSGQLSARRRSSLWQSTVAVARRAS